MGSRKRIMCITVVKVGLKQSNEGIVIISFSTGENQWSARKVKIILTVKYFLEGQSIEPKMAESKGDVNTHPSAQPQLRHRPSVVSVSDKGLIFFKNILLSKPSSCL